MIRTPLRPLARILEARQKGENPDAIERENKRIRHEQMRDASRQRAEGRLLVLGVFFFCAFTVVGARMGVMATTLSLHDALPISRFRDLGHPCRYCGSQWQSAGDQL